MINVIKGTIEHVHAAGSSRWRYFGVAQFTGVDLTGEIIVPDIKRARSVQLTPAGNGIAEQLSLDEPISADGWVAVPADGLTIDRNAGTTAGLKFFFSIEG